MSLNTLARNAFVAVTLASAVPNAGCNKTQQDVPEERSTQAVPGEREFPECDREMKTIENGRYGSGPIESGEETSWDCVSDRLSGRDCRAIREAWRARIKRIPDLFECQDGQAKLVARPSQLVELTNFSTTGIKGDCNGISAEYKSRIERVLDRLTCDKDGQLHEKLGFGEAKGGRIYNPCAGGHC